MKTKSEIYTELLKAALPVIRNVLTRRIVFGKLRIEAYELSQLVHSLPVTILDEQFDDHDIWFLNEHARDYCQSAQNTGTFTSVRDLLMDLFAIVPDEQKSKLEWEGP
ncbi:MAG: zinc ABC transporter substrate-binding protein [Spirochaetia bacterium]|nr:zinc ABC transporter substrate-binding protein [Spirochaetia bacterium]